MANDKDFLVNGPVVVGKDTKVTVGSITSSDIDLSTGNYFDDTLAANTTYTISNAGDVQAFQLEVTGGTAEVLSNFSTTLYTGNATARTITNGIDLANDGGLVWVKSRSSRNHILSDTERGTGKVLFSNLDIAEDADTTTITSYNSDGFTMDSSALKMNTNGEDFVSWTFKKAAGFFDVVTWTGNSTARAISHNLGCEVGSIFIKRVNSANEWVVYHRSMANNEALTLNTSDAKLSPRTFFDNTTPTSTEFYLSAGDSAVNGSGFTYVAYLFAHDDAADGLIQCGSYTGNGSTDGPEINLGWEPQWVMIKRATGGTGSWMMSDSMRGVVTGGNDAYLQANLTNAEAGTFDSIDFNSEGFKIKTTFSSWNTSGDTYIYVAIRAASDPDITWPSSIEWAGGIAPSAPATGETDVFTFTTDDGGTTYTGIQSIDNAS
jgi:hypothetical protein